ncbi:hypothetical protein [Calothrix sp. NIES-2098]|uniref:hypothetical protein n=1 Tax=Calothrix sp. NIES-2098 TaxID=1954171 RepID=UPI0030DC04CC
MSENVNITTLKTKVAIANLTLSIIGNFIAIAAIALSLSHKGAIATIDFTPCLFQICSS